MPVQAVTRVGWESVRRGSRMAMRAAALGSMQAIFWCVRSSAMSAADWHSLPVPAVVGLAIKRLQPLGIWCRDLATHAQSSDECCTADVQRQIAGARTFQPAARLRAGAVWFFRN